MNRPTTFAAEAQGSPPEEGRPLWLPDSPPLTAAGPGAWEAELRLSLGGLPWLADHGFQDLVVLPGAWYLEAARRLYRELFQREALQLRGITFERPVLLGEEPLTLTVRLAEAEGGALSCAFYEAGGEAPCARLAMVAAVPEPDDRAPFPPRAGEAVEDFYAQLRRNGNQYGPAFQTLTRVSLAGPEALGALSASGGEPLSVPVLDAAAQLLAAFTLGGGRTFILQAIERLTIHQLGGPGPWQARAVAETGTVQLEDADARLLWECAGLQLAFLERPAVAPRETRLRIAATFTAEPLQETLQFWGRHFERPVRVEFAPYQQVFQQLLDPASAFRSQADGLNLLVLHLPDWQPAPGHALPPAETSHFGERPRAVLPNGLEVAQLNAYETDYVYQEIFEDRSYLRHGIRLEEGDTVIDIGANIGLFSLFVLQECPGAQVYAYEPSPRVFDLLRANCAAHGGAIRPFHAGVAERSGSAPFTFYEHSSVFSSFHPDEEEDRAAVQAVVRNVLRQEVSEGGVQEADVEALTTDRLQAETLEVPLTSVSGIIREHGLERIHLLKIDAEKSELGILRGIEEAHWPRIGQIVMEVHDRSREAVEEIEAQLTRRGFRCAVVEEKLLETSGLFNLYATRRAPSAAADGLARRAGEFADALDAYAAAAPAPLVLAIAPHAASSELAAAEQAVLSRAARHPQVRTVSSASIRARYPVREWHDAHSHQLGHMPFTPEGYVALGTALARAAFPLSAPPVKVIALDCDNTLWQGQCGEDGPEGVQITAPFRRLQEFMVAQREAGVLLALCSKNREADALAVFDRPGLPLRREHFAAWQINWQPKPDNLRALAAQLGLGLESFLFLDDNPLECATVRAECPETLVLQLPAEPARIPAFLESLWVFDRAPATQEDRTRGEWYRANAERETERAAAPTLRAFLAGLQLQVEVAPATEAQLERVAQLSVRTNQFNFTGVRRTAEEIRALVRGGATCLVTSVRDRFGDYGLVGATLSTSAGARCVVETMLLSCRALGKGVEHRMLAEVARRALAQGRTSLELPYRRTERNEPARAFLEQLGTAAPGANLVLPAAELAALRYEPAETSLAAAPAAPAPARRAEYPNFSTALQRLGEELATVEAIAAALHTAPAAEPAGPELTESGSALERSLVAIWKKALGRARVGLEENFFDAGGTSLKAVVVVAMIRKELQRPVSIVTLFECPTIALLAARLEGGNSETAAGAESRGRLRRHKLVKRRVA